MQANHPFHVGLNKSLNKSALSRVQSGNEIMSPVAQIVKKPVTMFLEYSDPYPILSIIFFHFFYSLICSTNFFRIDLILVPKVTKSSTDDKIYIYILPNPAKKQPRSKAAAALCMR